MSGRTESTNRETRRRPSDPSHLPQPDQLRPGSHHRFARAASGAGRDRIVSTRITALRSIQVAIDLCVLSAALWVGFYVRFDWDVPQSMLRSLLVLWPYVVGIEYVVLVADGGPR